MPRFGNWVLDAAFWVFVALVLRHAWRELRAGSVQRVRVRQLRATARLSVDEAVALAAAAIEEPFYRAALAATLEERDGGLVWRVASMTIDMGVTAQVDDATGAVTDVQHWSAWPRR